MCLTKLLNIPQEYKDSSTEHIGYKVFRKRDIRYESPIYSQRLYRANQWIYDSKTRYDIIKATDDKEQYIAGFHIFPCAADARIWLDDKFDNFLIVYPGSIVIKQVKFKHAVAYGEEVVGVLKSKCVVAEQMYIVDE